MKKNLFLALIILILGCLVFVGCDAFEPTISSVELKSVAENDEILTYEIGSFNYEDYSLIVTYSDNSQKTLTLTEKMISDYDKLQLTYKGSHKITVKYGNWTGYINVKIIEKSIEQEDEELNPKLGSKTYTFLNNAYHCTYDGEYHSLEILGELPEGSTVTYPIGNSFKQAGTYNVNAVISANNYETISLWSTLVIDKAEYDLSNCSLYVAYESGATSFTYDGQSHEAVLRGTYPEGLTYEYYIGSQTEKFSTYTEGNSAIDAGDYYVVAKFTGDSTNYETVDENGDYKLYVYAPLVIDKKKYSEEFTKSIVFEDKTVTYDGKEHRLTLSGVTLPEGIRVEYQDANGNLFGSRTDANEEGYLVIAKFINDNEKNYEIDSEVKAKLYIKKASYDTSNLNVSFADGVESLDYDTLSHEVILSGLPKGVTVKSITCNGNEVTSFTNAGAYNIKVEFEPSDGNHKDVDALEKTLTINKIYFDTIDVQFESRTYTYSGAGYSLTYVENAKSIGVETTLSYTDEAGNTYEKLPKNVKTVGVYTAKAEYSYNKDNYTNAPDTVDPKIATLTVTRRIYDAENIVTMKYYEENYTTGVDHKSSVVLKTTLPDWVTSHTLTFYDPKGNETDSVVNAGVYTYQWTFTFFDGVDENATTKSKVGSFKVVGIQIKESDFLITYVNGGAGTYDGTTSFMPVAKSNFESSLNPYINLVYKFKQTGSTEYITVDEENYLETSYLSGEHIFMYTFGADNYEPKEKTITINVSPRIIKVSRTYFKVANYEGYYDGEDHKFGGLITPDVNTPYDENTGAGYNPDYQYISWEATNTTSNFYGNTTGNEVAGVDAGTFNYRLEFICLNSNYKIEQDEAAYFNYSVVINPLDYIGSVTGKSSWTGYDFSYLEYDDVNGYGNYINVSSSSSTAQLSSTKTQVSTAAIAYDATELYKFIKTIGTPIEDSVDYNFDVYTLTGIPFSGYNFKMIINEDSFNTSNVYENAFLDSLQNASYSIYYGYSYRNANSIYSGLTYSQFQNVMNDDSSNTLSRADGNGVYYLFVNMSNGDILVNGNSYICYEIHIDKYEMNYLCVDDSSNNYSDVILGRLKYTMSNKSNAEPVYTYFEDGTSSLNPALSTAFNLSDCTGLTASMMEQIGIYNYSSAFMNSVVQTYAGEKIYIDLFSSSLSNSIGKRVASFDSYHYIYVDENGSNAVSFNLKDGAALLASNSDSVTKIGTYYIVLNINDGLNLVYQTEKDGQKSNCNLIVLKVEVKPVELVISNVITPSGWFVGNPIMTTDLGNEVTELDKDISKPLNIDVSLAKETINKNSSSATNGVKVVAYSISSYSPTSATINYVDINIEGYISSNLANTLNYQFSQNYITTYFYQITDNCTTLANRTYYGKMTQYDGYTRVNLGMENDTTKLQNTPGFYYVVIHTYNDGVRFTDTNNGLTGSSDIALLFIVRPYENFYYTYTNEKTGEEETINLYTTAPTIRVEWTGATTYAYKYSLAGKDGCPIDKITDADGNDYICTFYTDDGYYIINGYDRTVYNVLNDAIYGGRKCVATGHLFIDKHTIKVKELFDKASNLKSEYNFTYRGTSFDYFDYLEDYFINSSNDEWGLHSLANEFAADFGSKVIKEILYFEAYYLDDDNRIDVDNLWIKDYYLNIIIDHTFIDSETSKYFYYIDLDFSGMPSGTYKEQVYDESISNYPLYIAKASDYDSTKIAKININPVELTIDYSKKHVEIPYSASNLFTDPTKSTAKLDLYNDIMTKSVNENLFTNFISDSAAADYLYQLFYNEDVIVSANYMLKFWDDGIEISNIKDIGSYMVTLWMHLDIIAGYRENNGVNSRLYVEDFYTLKVKYENGDVSTPKNKYELDFYIDVVPYRFDMTKYNEISGTPNTINVELTVDDYYSTDGINTLSILDFIDVPVLTNIASAQNLENYVGKYGLTSNTVKYIIGLQTLKSGIDFGYNTRITETGTYNIYLTIYNTDYVNVYSNGNKVEGKEVSYQFIVNVTYANDLAADFTFNTAMQGMKTNAYTYDDDTKTTTSLTSHLTIEKIDINTTVYDTASEYTHSYYMSGVDGLIVERYQSKYVKEITVKFSLTDEETYESGSGSSLGDGYKVYSNNVLLSMNFTMSFSSTSYTMQTTLDGSAYGNCGYSASYITLGPTYLVMDDPFMYLTNTNVGTNEYMVVKVTLVCTSASKVA